MATDRPEYFYHPAVGVISPTSLGLFRLNTAIPLNRAAGAPPAAIAIPAKTDPVQSGANQSIVAPQRNVMMPDVPPAKAPRRAQTLSRTDQCAVTGETCPLSEMIRFVISPDLVVTADLNEKLPGQPIYIKADRAVLKKAIWRNTFTTLARDTVKVPDNLIDIIEQTLSKQALETLSLARRAGELMMGFTAVEERVRAMPQGVYVVASDASDQGRGKIEKHLHGAALLDLWTSNELSHAIGEANTNHLFVGAGGLAEKLLRIAKKFKAVRSDVQK